MEEFLRVSSFNCRNIKSSIDNVRQLCDANDIIFFQETWLTFEELWVVHVSLDPREETERLVCGT